MIWKNYITLLPFEFEPLISCGLNLKFSLAKDFCLWNKDVPWIVYFIEENTLWSIVYYLKLYVYISKLYFYVTKIRFQYKKVFRRRCKLLRKFHWKSNFYWWALIFKKNPRKIFHAAICYSHYGGGRLTPNVTLRILWVLGKIRRG